MQRRPHIPRPSTDQCKIREDGSKVSWPTGDTVDFSDPSNPVPRPVVYEMRALLRAAKIARQRYVTPLTYVRVQGPSLNLNF